MGVTEPVWENAKEEEVWKYVAWHLSEAGIEAVLVGGAVVAIYSEGLYRSGDLDMIPDEFQRDRIWGVLEKIGFEKTQGRYYGHPRCQHLFVEFPRGPVELGEQFPIEPAEELVAGRMLKILSPTDCVKDRLAGFIHWGTRDLFDQAVLVCQRQAKRILWNELRQWCEGEGDEEVFKKLREAVEDE